MICVDIEYAESRGGNARPEGGGGRLIARRVSACPQPSATASILAYCILAPPQLRPAAHSPSQPSAGPMLANAIRSPPLVPVSDPPADPPRDAAASPGKCGAATAVRSGRARPTRVARSLRGGARGWVGQGGWRGSGGFGGTELILRRGAQRGLRSPVLGASAMASGDAGRSLTHPRWQSARRRNEELEKSRSFSLPPLLLSLPPSLP
jgi:hypothetical protein